MTDNQRDRTPMQAEAFWEEVYMELLGADVLLFNTHVETKEEALRGTYRRQTGLHPDALAMTVIRQRNITGGYDQLKYYLDRGRLLLPVAWDMYAERNFSFEFARVRTR